MENAEKMQDVAAQEAQENPEEVQQSTELNNKEKAPVMENEQDAVTSEESDVTATTSEELIAPEEITETAAKEAVSEEPSSQTEQTQEEEAAGEEKDASDHHEEEDDHEEEDLDFEHATKQDLLAKIKEIRKEERIRRVDRVLKALRPRYDVLHEEERVEALKRFEADGNDPDAFEYHGDEVDREFQTIYDDLRAKRNRYFRELEQQKDDNLKRKQELLEQLREIVDGEETVASMNAAKDIQAEWKRIGPVPGAFNKTLWANYNALLDRFYDQRSIYFELKDLDRKKNQKIKEELCEKAEALVGLEDLKTAIVQLNELHDEYKHAGPVPREVQESLWQRFKAASDAVYARRKEYFDHLKVELEANFEKKRALAQEAEVYISFNSDKITDWNAKTKEIQELQKKWEAIGGLPRDKAKATNKQFWGAFKKFFTNKNHFFKQLESKRDENQQLKEELVSRAEALKESSEWNDTTRKMKELQAEWREIGPVPEKVRNEIYKRFKSACDHFFDRRRAQNSEQEKEYQENLNLKLQICEQIEAIAEQDEINLDDVYDLVDNHASLGFVPRNAIKKAQSRFEEATHKILTLEDLEAGDKADLKNHIDTSRLRNSPGGNRKLQRREGSIRRKISELENNISTWNTNMEFFASSATADKLKADLQQQINQAKGELEELKAQLSALSS